MPRLILLSHISLLWTWLSSAVFWLLFAFHSWFCYHARHGYNTLLFFSLLNHLLTTALLPLSSLISLASDKLDPCQLKDVSSGIYIYIIEPNKTFCPTCYTDLKWTSCRKWVWTKNQHQCKLNVILMTPLCPAPVMLGLGHLGHLVLKRIIFRYCCSLLSQDLK